MKRISALPFAGTAAQETELRGWLDENRDVPGVVLSALQKAQEIYGYLPLEVQRIVSEVLDKPLAELYGIATFYSQFSLSPKGQYKVNVCLGTACYVKGSGDIYANLKQLLNLNDAGLTPDGKFSLEAVRCIGACGLAPVLMVNDDVYGRLTGDSGELKEILDKY
jgi:NADH:ubiquinone oxidoreductase subunit E